MFKLVIQAAVAFAIWFGAKSFELHYGASIALIVAGFVGVHLFWEKFMFNPYAYLGVMPVDPSDPLMRKAEEKASSTLEYFLNELYPRHSEDSMVKFPYVNAENETEKLWADLVSMSENEVKVFVRTPPVAVKSDFDREMILDVKDILDWSVETKDGDLLGGFSNQALFKIFEREEGYLHPKFYEHISRFKEIESKM